jgi:hypothetical protein
MIKIQKLEIDFPKWKWWQYLIFIVTVMYVLKGDIYILKELFPLILSFFN